MRERERERVNNTSKQNKWWEWTGVERLAFESSDELVEAIVRRRKLRGGREGRVDI